MVLVFALNLYSGLARFFSCPLLGYGLRKQSLCSICLSRFPWLHLFSVRFFQSDLEMVWLLILLLLLSNDMAVLDLLTHTLFLSQTLIHSQDVCFAYASTLGL